ncbi:uncharacterized protein LOC141901706 [Tubulanus polymorphus]|uniref:uncharacterized protein LOC141901706 n=1 Tax=Tubulanus polymorphus TaxID=672921 RepID=UPI003DA37E44
MNKNKMVNSAICNHDELQGLMSCFDEFRRTGFLCDAELIASGLALKVHRVLLAAWSHVLASEFRTCEKNGQMKFELGGLSQQQLMKLVEFFYTGHVELNHTNILVFQNVAAQLKIPYLSSICEKSFENVCKTENNQMDVHELDESDANDDISEMDLIEKPMILVNNSNCLLIETKDSLGLEHKLPRQDIGVIENVVSGEDIPSNGFACAKCDSSFTSFRAWKAHNGKCCKKATKITKNLAAERNISSSANLQEVDSDCKMCANLFTDGETVMPVCEGLISEAESRLFCKVCQYRAESVTALRNHVHRIHLCDDFRCEYCGITYAKIDVYADHLKDSHGKNCNADIFSNLKLLTCEICEEFTSYRQLILKYHKLKKHSVTTPHKHSCGVCSETFETKMKLCTHRVKAHPKAKHVIKCKICHFSTHDKKNLEYHMYAKHKILSSEKTVYQCPNCAYTSLVEHYVQMHIKNKHSSERPHVCETCLKTFKTVSALNVHAKRHVIGNEYKCSQCEYVTNVAANLKGHTQRCHPTGVVFRCSLCSFQSGFKHDLEKHTRTVKHKQTGKAWNRRARMGLDPPNTAQSKKKWIEKRRLQNKLKKADITESDILALVERNQIKLTASGVNAEILSIL